MIHDNSSRFTTTVARLLFKALAYLFLILFPAEIFAIVAVNVTYSSAPLQINLTWNSQGTGSQVQIFRRVLGEEGSATWVSKATVVQPVLSYSDNTVSFGITYEYRLAKVGDSVSQAYVVAGLNIPIVENRGTILLVVDNTMITALSSELQRLEQDLRGDGWNVVRYNSARHGSGTPVALKSWIKSQYDASPTTVKSLLLLGRLPIVMSGWEGPDGHGSHTQPSDLFYADMDGAWTDSSNFGAGNIPGDGNYDQNYIPGNSRVEMQVGRVDLAGMTAFSSSETELLRLYLNKDHNWRHAITKAPLKAIAGNGYLNMENAGMYSLFGSSNVTTGTFANTANTPYTWAVDFGDYNGSNYPGYTYKVPFTINFGSHKQNFQANNNAMRAILALPEYGLTSAWGSRPFWFFHHMGMGEPIGYSAFRTQNNVSNDYAPACSYWFQGAIWNNLMGDPTLRMHIVEPPSNFSAEINGGSVDLSWTASPDANNGYHIYRATSEAGPYFRLSSSPIVGTSYVDLSPGSTSYYMLRALKLELAASGSFNNASQGIFIQNPFNSVGDTLAPTAPTNLLASNYNASGLTLSWTESTDNIAVTSYEVFKDGTSIGTTTLKTFEINGLNANINYALTVKAKDSAGNYSAASASRTVMIDTQAPATPTNIVSSTISQNAFTLSWATATDNVGVTGYDVYVNGVYHSSPVKPNTATPLPTTLRVTAVATAVLSVTVKAKDKVGNVSNASVPLEVSTLPLDPNVLRLNPSHDTGESDVVAGTNTTYWCSASATLYMKFDLSSITGSVNSAVFRIYNGVSGTIIYANSTSNDTWVEGSAKPTKGSLITSTTAPSGYADLDLTSLIQSEMAGNKIVSIAVSTNTSGASWYNSRENVANQPQLVLNGSFVPDSEAPSIPTNLIASNIGLTSFTIGWTASTDNMGVTAYEILKDGVAIGTSSTTTFNVTGLTQSTSYQMMVKAKDGYGNLSPASTALSVTTLSSDTQAPTIPTGLASSSITQTSFTLSWTPSTDNVGVTGYDIYKNGALHGTVTTTSVSITGLSAGTNYSITIKAKDLAGNVSPSSMALSVTTLSPADTQAPTKPTGLASSSITQTSFTLSWIASTDNVGVTGYDIYKNGVLHGTSTATTIIVTGLTASTSYSMLVKARDLAGNVSAPSVALLVETLASGDTLAPAVPTNLRVKSE